MRAASTSLLHSGACCFKRSPDRLERADALDPNASELEREIYERASCSDGFPIKEFPKLAASSQSLHQIGNQLMETGLLIPDENKLAIRFFPFLIALVVPVVGFVKIMVGLSRHRPVAYLTMGCIVATIIAVCFLCWRLHRSRRGDLLMRQLRNRHYALQHTVQARQAACSPSDVSIAVSLFGLGVLVGSPLGALHAAFGADRRGSSGCGSACGGGCGGGGCGGGCGGCGG
jgi:uncharacterized protein (TIGR04222 family)